MQLLRSDIWCAAFVRRHNDLGRLCVIARRGDAIAGQIWIEIDHLDGTATLLTPISTAAQDEPTGDRLFQRRFDRADPADIRERIAREVEFDPDIWIISIDSRGSDVGVDVV